MPPDLDGENYRRGQKQSPDSNMSDGRDHHGQFGLGCVMTPNDASLKSDKAKTELGDQQGQHRNCRTSDGFDLRVLR